MKRINLITHDNGVGLTQDVKILKDVLKDHTCNFIEHKIRGAVDTRADINIFLELINPKFLPLAPVNIFMPNPEWFWDTHLLKFMDLILVKTRDAERIFSRLTRVPVMYTSFTCEDRYETGWDKEKTFLHTAGHSSAKGTDGVFIAFNQKKMPPLIFTKLHKFGKYSHHSDNITTCFVRMPFKVLKGLQNKCLFHVCTSEYEGFGHYIWEGMSTGSIIISTNAIPMTEFIKEDYGFLVKVRAKKRHNLDILNIIDTRDLQKVVMRVMDLPDDKLKQMSEKSRQAFLDNDKIFRYTINKIINNL